MFEPGEEVDVLADDACDWAGPVRLLQRMVATTRLGGADDDALYDVAEGVLDLLR